jgi:hypothetical protein
MSYEIIYRGYHIFATPSITDSTRLYYVIVAPYGKYCPQIFDMLIKAKKAVVDDIKARSLC